MRVIAFQTAGHQTERQSTRGEKGGPAAECKDTFYEGKATVQPDTIKEKEET